MPTSNLQAYTLLFETANGALLAQEQSITIDRTTNSQPVNTVPGGYSGESPGAAMMEVTVMNAVPAGGFEFDAGSTMAALIPTSLYTLGPGGKQLKGECFIHADSIRHGVNQVAEYTFRARGKFALWS
jgi:hypothetical protein